MNLSKALQEEFRAAGKAYLSGKRFDASEEAKSIITGKSTPRDAGALIRQFGISTIARFKETYSEASSPDKPELVRAAYASLAKCCRGYDKGSFTVNEAGAEAWKELAAMVPPTTTQITEAARRGFFPPLFAAARASGTPPENIRLPKGADTGKALIWASVEEDIALCTYFGALSSKDEESITAAAREAISKENPELLKTVLSAGPLKKIKSTLGYGLPVKDVACAKVLMDFKIPFDSEDAGMALAWKEENHLFFETSLSTGVKPSHACLKVAANQGRLDRIGIVLNHQADPEGHQYMCELAAIYLCSTGSVSNVLQYLDSPECTPAKAGLFDPGDAGYKRLRAFGDLLSKSKDHDAIEQLMHRGLPPEALSGIEDDSIFKECALKFLERDSTLPESVWESMRYRKDRDDKAVIAACAPLAKKLPMIAVCDIVGAPKEFDRNAAMAAIMKCDWDGSNLSINSIAERNDVDVTSLAIAMGPKFDADNLSTLIDKLLEKEHVETILDHTRGRIDTYAMNCALSEGSWTLVEAFVDRGVPASSRGISDIPDEDLAKNIPILKRVLDGCRDDWRTYQASHFFMHAPELGRHMLDGGLKPDDVMFSELAKHGLGELIVELATPETPIPTNAIISLARAQQFDVLAKLQLIQPEISNREPGYGNHHAVDDSLNVATKRKLIEMGFDPMPGKTPAIPTDPDILPLVLELRPDKLRPRERGILVRQEIKKLTSTLLPKILPAPSGKASRVYEAYATGALAMEPLREIIEATGERKIKVLSEEVLKAVASIDRADRKENLPHREFILKYTSGNPRWQSIVRHNAPLGLGSQSPLGFSMKNFIPVLGAAIVEAKLTEQNELGAVLPAYNLSILYGNLTETLKVAKKRYGPETTTPLHDLGQFSLPQHGVWHPEAWRPILMHHAGRGSSLLGNAPTIEKGLNRAPKTLAEAQDAAAKYAYSNADEHPRLARLLHEQGVTQPGFNKYLALMKMEKNSESCPDVKVNCATIGLPGLVFEKLPSNSIEGPALGLITRCCQHLDGVASDCARHGFKSPNGAFYALRRDTGDRRIVAQTWAWRGKKDELVFDSWEPIGPNYGPACKPVLEEAAKQIVGRLGICRVLVGSGGRTEGFTEVAKKAAIPSDFKGYRDSHSQHLILESPPEKVEIPMALSSRGKTKLDTPVGSLEVGVCAVNVSP